MENSKYKPIPYELVERLIFLYEKREKYDEAAGAYDALTEKITKIKGAIEYIASEGEEL